MAERIGLVIRDSEIEHTGLNGRASTIGQSTVGLRVSGVDRLQMRVIVVEELPEGQEMLLSCNDLKAFGLIHQDFPKPCVSAGDTLHIAWRLVAGKVSEGMADSRTLEAEGKVNHREDAPRRRAGPGGQRDSRSEHRLLC